MSCYVYYVAPVMPDRRAKAVVYSIVYLKTYILLVCVSKSQHNVRLLQAFTITVFSVVFTPVEENLVSKPTFFYTLQPQNRNCTFILCCNLVGTWLQSY